MASRSTLKPVRAFKSPGSHLCGLCWDGTHLWHSDGNNHTLYKLDRESGRILATLYCPEVRTGLAFDGTHLWQVSGHPKRIRIIRPKDGQVEREISLGPNAESVCGLAVEGGSYWTGPEGKGFVEEHSQESGETLRRYGPVSSADGIALVGSLLWFTSYRDRLLIGVDLETGEEARRYALACSPTGMCWDGKLFWFNDFSNGQILAVRLED